MSLWSDLVCVCVGGGIIHFLLWFLFTLTLHSYSLYLLYAQEAHPDSKKCFLSGVVVVACR